MSRRCCGAGPWPPRARPSQVRLYERALSSFGAGSDVRISAHKDQPACMAIMHWFMAKQLRD